MIIIINHDHYYYPGNCDSNASCHFIWTRRRLLSLDPSGAIAPGDITLFVLQVANLTLI